MIYIIVIFFALLTVGAIIITKANYWHALLFCLLGAAYNLCICLAILTKV
jgi:hypothetical protein